MALEFKKKETYFALIKNSIGSELFSDLFFMNNSGDEFEGIPPHQVVNVSKGGQLSCPYYVSCILHLIGGVIDAPHATIGGTLRAMRARGWQELSAEEGLMPGDVVLWEKKEDDGSGHYSDGHEHIGFILEKNLATSSSSRQRKIISHDPEFKNMGPDIKERKIIKVFAHPELSDRWEDIEKK